MSFYELYLKSLAKVILDEADKIIQSEKPWDEKYDLIFSEEISKAFKVACPGFDYYDPDCSYEDDVLAWFNAAKYAVVAVKLKSKEEESMDNLEATLKLYEK